MSNVPYVQALLQEEWTPSRPGRADVPKPAIVSAKEQPTISTSMLQQQDWLHVKDGGVSEYEPLGLGWEAENATDRVTLDVRTVASRGGRNRLQGTFDPDNPGDYTFESNGGLMGECKAIINRFRRGHGAYDNINLYEINDLSGDMGKQVFRAVAEIRLDAYAQELIAGAYE